MGIVIIESQLWIIRKFCPCVSDHCIWVSMHIVQYMYVYVFVSVCVTMKILQPSTLCIMSILSNGKTLGVLWTLHIRTLPCSCMVIMGLLTPFLFFHRINFQYWLSFNMDYIFTQLFSMNDIQQLSRTHIYNQLMWLPWMRHCVCPLRGQQYWLSFNLGVISHEHYPPKK